MLAVTFPALIVPAERELIVSNPTYAVPTLIELKLPVRPVTVPTVSELAIIEPVLRDVILAIPAVAIPALIELNAPPAVVRDPIEPLLMEPAKSVPTVKLLNEPVPALRFVVFIEPDATIPALIELNAPAAVNSEPIEPLLIEPANRVPIVKELAVPTATLKKLVFSVPVVRVEINP